MLEEHKESYHLLICLSFQPEDLPYTSCLDFELGQAGRFACKLNNIPLYYSGKEYCERLRESSKDFKDKPC